MKLLINWILYTLAIVFIAWLIPGIHVNNLMAAFFVVVVLGLINTFIKPLLMFIALPINFLTLGFFTLIINAFLLFLTGKIAPGFEVHGFLSAFFGALILSLLGGFIGSIDKDRV